MLKINTLLLSCLVCGNALAFAPSTSNKAFVSKPLFAETTESGGALVPVNEETVEFTAGIVGGVVGFAIGGPVLGAVTAAAANYASRSDLEVTEVVQTVSKSAIEVYNYLSELDAKYELLTNAQTSLQVTLEKVKENEKVNPATIQKIEDALSSTTSKIDELNEEYDLVGGVTTALGVVGDLVEKAVQKAGEVNEEYKLTDKALSSINSAVEKAKERVG